MTRGRRLLLPLLFCLLVVTWGVCPCVFARMVGIGKDQAPRVEQTEKAAHCRCCKTPPATDAPSPARPEKCPCCERGGALRDLPPPGADVVLDAPDVPGLPAAAVATLACVSAPPAAEPVREATGPPLGCAPHACPVGIVLLLN